MADRIQFEVVSPERLLLSQAVEMVVLPGAEGDFGALPEHAPTVAALRPGVISVFENNQVIERIFVAGGFAEATPSGCTVLAETALRVAEIERSVVVERIQEIRGGTIADGIEVELAVQEAMLEALDRAA